MAASSCSEIVHGYSIYGLAVASKLALPELDTAQSQDSAADAAVTLELASGEEVAGRFSSGGRRRGRLASREGAVEVWQGASGDLLLRSAAHGLCHVARDGSQIGCATPDPWRPQWRRFLLDTVLGTSALRRGLVGLHAAAVTVGGGVVAIAGTTGAGKTTLAAHLIRDGAQLFCDDLLFLADGDGAPGVHPGPPLISLPLPEADAQALGTLIALLQDSAWVRCRRQSPRTFPLALVVVLDRQEGAIGERLEPASAGLLLRHALQTGLEAERQVRRLAALARLARHVPVLCLTAAPTSPPSRLAALVRSAAHMRVRWPSDG
jgi:hypothetical protein